MTHSSPAEAMRWWGWGARDTDVPDGLIRVLRDQLGISGEVVSQPPPLDDVGLPKPNIPPDLRSALVDLVGDRGVRLDLAERVRHAIGRSYIDLLKARSGVLDSAPDAVVYPVDGAQVSAVLRACAEHSCAVIPFGGGTSVVGGVEALRGTHQCAIALDVRNLGGVSELDSVSLLATVDAGMRAVDCEQELNRHGLTLGHFPQSYEFASIGGYAATRSAGQTSSGYGRFDDMVVGLRCATPMGELVVHPFPSTGAGPSLMEVVLGSEGTLGVITEVTLRVHHRAASPHYEGWSFPTFVDGVEAFRRLSQAGIAPDVVRLSDENETRMNMTMATMSGVQRLVAEAYLRAHGQLHGCLAIVGWERDAHAQTARREATSRVLGRAGGVPLGNKPGKAWLRSRYEGPYLRDALLDRGVLVETLETATTWKNLDRLKRQVTESITDSLRDNDGHSPLIGCHVSHIYPTGASLYITVLGKQSGDPIAQWQLAKTSAMNAIVEGGGTITHHHAVGVDHAPWLEKEGGSLALAALRAVKQELDPAGIMNPGKVFTSFRVSATRS